MESSHGFHPGSSAVDAWRRRQPQQHAEYGGSSLATIAESLDGSTPSHSQPHSTASSPPQRSPPSLLPLPVASGSRTSLHSHYFQKRQDFQASAAAGAAGMEMFESSEGEDSASSSSHTLASEHEGHLGSSGAKYGDSDLRSKSTVLHGGNDEYAFRGKARAGLAYLGASTLYELFTYKIAQRTEWQNAILTVPAELVALTAASSLALYIARKKGNLRIQAALTSEVSYKPTRSRWSQIMPLAVAVVASSSLRLLKDGFVDPTISSAASVYIAPSLLILLPLLHLPTELSTNSLLTLSALLIPALYGLFINNLQILLQGAIFTLAFLLAESCKMAFAKRWMILTSSSASQTITSYLPVAASISLSVIAPLARLNGAPDHRPHLWQLYLVAHTLLSLANQFTLLRALDHFDSPISVAIVAVPRGVLVSFLTGGIKDNQGVSSHAMITTATMALLALAVSSRELRNRIPGIKQFNYRLHSRESYEKSSSLGRQKSLASVRLDSQLVRWLALASFLPLIYWIAVQGIYSHTSALAMNPISDLTASRTIDIVISYYDEPIERVRAHIKNMRYYPWIRYRDPRFIIYSKGPGPSNETLTDAEFLARTRADKMIHLEQNAGREGGTYIHHILTHYNGSVEPAAAQAYRHNGLADHTLFMQPHLAWDWIARERMWLFQDTTGYLHFAPYIKMDCGRDLEGNGDFHRMREIYSMFRGELCPPTYQLGAYSSQFVVSKKRILENSYAKYKILSDVLEAGPDHWIHQEGTWWHYKGEEPGPANPYFGHALERAWPTIFGCIDPSIADTCAGENYNITGCQCFDQMP